VVCDKSLSDAVSSRPHVAAPPAFGERDGMRSRALPLPGPVAADLTCVRIDFPDDAQVGADDPEGLQGWADVSLDPEERVAWEAIRSARRRQEWLMGRLAAKDAVRGRLEARGMAPEAAAIAIRPDSLGCPRAAGPAVEGSGAPMAISIAHTRGVAAAVAGATADGLGLDIERIDRRRGDYERAAFTDEERRRLDAGPGDQRAERALRLFCAKEAVAKAIGRGLMGSPLNLRVLDCDAEVRHAGLEVAGSLARVLPAFRGQRLPAWIGMSDRLVVAWARVEEAPAP
jgi:4'-phosphopantetheinyl transferase EntD